ARHDPLLVAHADLPFADDLAALTHFPGVTIVPDRRDDGTNVVCIPADVAFAPEYGTGSFPRHLAQLLRSGRPVRVSRRPALQWDVDSPSDLAGFRRLDVPA
ncbi:MAG TPA: hypothetical protein VFV35_02130, partial [Acidimicrobiales bacterium]|nr:hypothetical protein [Acidimicrobiales bacterium]